MLQAQVLFPHGTVIFRIKKNCRGTIERMESIKLSW